MKEKLQILIKKIRLEMKTLIKQTTQLKVMPMVKKLKLQKKVVKQRLKKVKMPMQKNH